MTHHAIRPLIYQFINSLAVLPPQSITNGIVKIQIVEGSITDITVEGLERLNPEYIISRVRLASLSPFNRDRLEDQLKLLRVNPLFENVEANIRASNKSGQSILVIKAKEANPLIANFNIDNYSPSSIGSERFGVN
jgi:hemolysin activation/secretion protein